MVVGEIVRDWMPVIEFNCQGHVMVLPVSIIHRYRNSLLSQYFRKDFKGERKEHEGRIFLERNPRIFRMMIKYIRSNGKMNLSTLQKTDDWGLF